MGVEILNDTSPEPITMMGKYAGLCWGSDTEDSVRNFNRGIECLQNNHGRVMEYPQIYMLITDYSARVIREFGRHVGGLPTYLQESTRYVNDGNFDYNVPPLIKQNKNANTIYVNTMETICSAIKELNDCGIKKEDSAMLLPLGMDTKIVWRGNLRVLFDMSRQRICYRAYWEFRKLMKDIMYQLSDYSEEWDYLINIEKIFKPKCEDLGYCPEKYGCGKYPKKVQK